MADPRDGGVQALEYKGPPVVIDLDDDDDDDVSIILNPKIERDISNVRRDGIPQTITTSSTGIGEGEVVAANDVPSSNVEETVGAVTEGFAGDLTGDYYTNTTAAEGASLPSQPYVCHDEEDHLNSMWNEWVKRSRISFSELSPPPSQHDSPHRASVFAGVDQMDLDNTLFAGSSGKISPLHSARVSPRNTSVEEISVHHPTPWNDMSDDVNVENHFITSDDTDVRVVPIELPDHTSIPRGNGKHSPMRVDSAIPVSSGKDPKLVTQPRFGRMQHVHDPLASGIPDDISSHFGVHGRFSDVQQKTGEYGMEEEGSIFLIKDDLDIHPGFVGKGKKRASHPQFSDEYTVMSNGATGTDSNAMQENIGSETLDFTFSYGDDVVLQNKQDASMVGGKHMLSARDNFSFCGFGSDSHRSMSNEVSDSGSQGNESGERMHVGELNQPQFGSDGVVIDSHDHSPETLSFSDRVFRFVASLRSAGSASATPKSVKTEEPVSSGSNSSRKGEKYKSSNGNDMEGNTLSSIKDSVINLMRSTPMYDLTESTDEDSPRKHTAGKGMKTHKRLLSRENMMPGHGLVQLLLDNQSSPTSPMKGVTENGISSCRNYDTPSLCRNGNLTAAASLVSSPLHEGLTGYGSPSPLRPSGKTFMTVDDKLHTKGLFDGLSKGRKPYDEQVANLGALDYIPPSKRKISSNCNAVTPEDKQHSGTELSYTVTVEAYRLVQATIRSIKVLIGAKLSGMDLDMATSPKGKSSDDIVDQNNAADFKISRSLLHPPTQNRRVYEETTAFVSKMIEKLRAINSVKEQLRLSLEKVSNGSPLGYRGLETYSSLVRSTRRLERSINGSELVSAMQHKLMLVKVERIKLLRSTMERLIGQQQLYKKVIPKIENLDNLLSVVSNAYNATGIKVVPLSFKDDESNWSFVVSFNSELNTKRSPRSFPRNWHNDLVRSSDRRLAALMDMSLEYHRLKEDCRFNTEINMVVYLSSQNGCISDDSLGSCVGSVVTLKKEPPDYDETSTPPGKAHVPLFRSHELPSNGPLSVRSPYGYNHVYCSINGGQSESATTIHVTESRDMADSLQNAHESPRLKNALEASICNINWEDVIDVNEIRNRLRILFTYPRTKQVGSIAKVWEHAQMLLVDEANKHVDKIISRLTANGISLSLFTLIQGLTDHGSAISARIRSAQRELLQLLNYTSGANLEVSDGRMTITTMLPPKEANKQFLQCYISVKVYDLLQKGSYLAASADVSVSALLTGGEVLASAVNGALAASERKGKIYEMIADACAHNNHKLLI